MGLVHVLRRVPHAERNRRERPGHIDLRNFVLCSSEHNMWRRIALFVSIMGSVGIAGLACSHPNDGAVTAGDSGGIERTDASADGVGSGADSGSGGNGGHSCASSAQCVPPTPACVKGSCVECAGSSDCASAMKPICDVNSNTCQPCTSDQQCIDKSGFEPGVCMSHVDGHCATPSETIYVTQSSGCIPLSSHLAEGDAQSGTNTNPLCTMEQVPTLLASGLILRDLVVVRGVVGGGDWIYTGQGGVDLLTVVGQNTAAIANGVSPGFVIQSGAAYLRDLEIDSTVSDGLNLQGGTLTIQHVTIGGGSSSSIGIDATGGSLKLLNVTVDSCAGGGILLDGASFDIEDTNITNNGPGSQNGMSWGGVLVTSLSESAGALIQLSNIETNNGGGITCFAAVSGKGVFVSNNINTPFQVSTSCGFSSCSTPGSTCGAQ